MEERIEESKESGREKSEEENWEKKVPSKLGRMCSFKKRGWKQ